MCVHPDKAAMQRLGSGISIRRHRTMEEDSVGTPPRFGIDHLVTRCDDNEGGGKQAGAESTPRRLARPNSDHLTNHRADEDACGSTRGGNEG